MKTRHIGILQVIAAGICFGFLGIFGKQLFTLGLSVGEILAFRFLFASVFLGSWLLITDRKSFYLKPKDWVLCAGQGVLGYALFASLYFKAIEGVSVPLAALLLFTYPILIHLFAWILKLEKLSKLQWFSLPVVILGLSLVLWGEIRIDSWWSVLAGLLASITYSIYVLVSNRLQKNISPLSANFIVICFATLALFIGHWVSPLRILNFSLTVWALIAGLALICSVAAMSLFLAGLQKLKAAEASVFSTSEPVAAVIFSALLLNQELNWQTLVGALLVVIAILMGSLAQTHELNLHF